MWIVKPVTINDAEYLLDIYRPYIEKTAITFEYDVPTLDEFRERILTISRKYPYLKAVDENGNIVGYAYANTFKGRAAYDWSVETTVYVYWNYRGHAVGKELYNALEKALQSMGILNMNACIAVTNGQDDHLTDESVKFHEKMGFSLVGCFHNSGFKFNTWYDMIWMEKMIGEHECDQPSVQFGTWVLD